MVKFRGIEIVIISQFDIERLPEYAHRTSPLGAFDATSASCYVPTYPGSQIWFEYCVEGPHPPNAAYFFKLFINRVFITSWDCTAKYDYHGKTSYSLRCCEGTTGAGSLMQRRLFQFSNCERDDTRFGPLDDDCIEIRVHRIEHRQRIRTENDLSDESFRSQSLGKLKLVNGGILEPYKPQRRYKYQLLDPSDTPFAKFCFYYRSHEWLENHGLTKPSLTADEDTDSSFFWYDAHPSDLPESSPSGYGSPDYSKAWMASLSPSLTHSPNHKHHLSPSSNSILENISPRRHPPSGESRNDCGEKRLPIDDPDDSLSVVPKGGIEDLPPAVPRSPQSLKTNWNTLRAEKRLPSLPRSSSRSPRKKLPNEYSFDIQHRPIRGRRNTRRLSRSNFENPSRQLDSPISMNSAVSSDEGAHEILTSEEREAEGRSACSKGERFDPQNTNSPTCKTGRSLLRALSRRAC